ncbi:MAG: hypothetical protein A3H57_00160 [Candidatus Taylorbacteria bacterium RIFCSPLOWO2_02_FULL_43_11]|uniref:PDZ domain-containing protein n=1 Tax=Candidatus Taylorbacteria bacterium RIFCSPHIGHO2_02_FULL_43_32b TaxID=1802306 RepID=A0A1G2MI35_9BACT|nr:MAG: hypothetical protein A2743_02650 [Candidatus Taylorbacteria bacterium RIFCSPHIGHO2_01_FULL_43_47]OHA23538.1 MAG: hypothetical protein A3C72_04805 [Candidatus Taylorbacteria bacterium RIFCSPHIGHO2_02_FULL_43_32b]OHA30540.1 MAG: hypothetical protein A3B08_04335 [Candidatus Taylorbacteria bacterium RIFCSPLOWO2_01_FULL_43_44]OHA37100.1 MAG: hypothetical protein A3H57_00160 [Candidatus Taylorbacteria bacterium RIFCSPLOWO2_02_FULL_43_11]
MYIVTFIIVLGILVFVHELGHFLAAKAFGVRVDEFALGFPPRIFGKKIGETVYAINMIPIGGYVKILGEDGDESLKDDEVQRKGKRFSEVSRPKQAIILSAGILGNIIFAWLAISIGFMIGLPSGQSVPFAKEIGSPSLIISAVLPGSPAFDAGLIPGDRIVELKGDGNAILYPNGESAGEFISNVSSGTPIELSVLRKGATTTVSAVAEEGIVEGKRGIGIAMEYAGILKLAPHKAVIAGTYATWDMTKSVGIGIYDLIKDAVKGEAKWSSFSGPVGIALMVGDAEKAGFVNLLILVVLISINLAMINLLPFPALDGGRLVFVAIEAIIRKPVNQKFFHMANQIGFIALLILMAVITYKDITKL